MTVKPKIKATLILPVKATNRMWQAEVEEESLSMTFHGLDENEGLRFSEVFLNEEAFHQARELLTSDNKRFFSTRELMRIDRMEEESDEL